MSRVVSRLLAVALLAGVAGLPGVILPSGAGAAAVIVVTTIADEMDPNDGLVSLREAAALANVTGDATITLAANATYLLTMCAPPLPGAAFGPLDVRPASSPNPAIGIAIAGNGSTVEQTCGAISIPTVQISGGRLSLEQLRIRSTGSCIASAGSPTLSLAFVVLEGCVSQAIDGSRSLTLSMTDSRVTGTTPPSDSRPAVDVKSAVLLRSSIDRNAAGLWASGTLSMTDSHVDLNAGKLPGVVVNGPMIAVDSTFDDNSVVAADPRNAGAAGIVGFSQVLLTRVSISRNTGPRAGLEIGLSPTLSSRIIDSVIDDNVATGTVPNQAFAGVYVYAAPLVTTSMTLLRTTVNRNRAPRVAGIVSDGTLSINDSTITGNQVTAGSALYPAGVIVGAKDIAVAGSTIAGNTVAASAPTDLERPFVGGIRVAGALTMDNTTISGNRGDVGGIYAAAGGAISQSTIADNSALANNAANVLAGTTLQVQASVIASSATARSCATASAASIISLGYNFDSGASCGVGPGTGDTANAGDPLLGALAANGGPSPTRVPSADSPLIDRRPEASPSCAGTDQRGVTRPQGGGCDIGAVEVTQPGTRYHPVLPTRILDSRTATGGWNSPLVAGTSRSVTVTGGAVAPTATAVVLNVTATDASQGSFINVWPTGSLEPNASSLNFAAGETIANLVTVKVGAQGNIQFSNNAGGVDVVADLVGYFDDGAGLGDRWTGLLNSTRLLDSRTQTGGWNSKLAAGTPRDLMVRGRGGVSSSASAVVANVTVTDSSEASFVRVWPSGPPPPVVSNLNFAAGQTIANLVTTKIGDNGAIRIDTKAGDTHVIIDVVGFFDPTQGGVFRALRPVRVLDDRVGIGAIGPWTPQSTRSVSVTNLPVSRAATGIALNLTVTNATEGSFVTAFPGGEARPASSTINFSPGQTIANHVMVRAGASTGGQIELFNQIGSVDLVADVVGYYAAT